MVGSVIGGGRKMRNILNSDKKFQNCAEELVARDPRDIYDKETVIKAPAQTVTACRERGK